VEHPLAMDAEAMRRAGYATVDALVARLTAAAANLYCGAWLESAGPTQVELEVIDWFRDWLGLPAGTAGVLVNGGSAANLTALLVAREAAGGPSPGSVLYVSDQAHSSLARTARAMGLRQRWLDQHRRRRSPRRSRRRLCRRTAVLHVDAAYGGFAALTAKGGTTLAGIDRADSVTLDPHKWLYQPMECGCVLIRDGARLEQTFAIHPDYLDGDAAQGAGEVNFAAGACSCPGASGRSRCGSACRPSASPPSAPASSATLTWPNTPRP
jgi:aromatic-L-amino-acid/L-tryptophan decarboxylase